MAPTEPVKLWPAIAHRIQTLEHEVLAASGSRLLVTVTAERDEAAGHHRRVVDRRTRV